MFLTFVFRYSIWHYLQAPRLILCVWSNLLWYLGHLFSVGSLWKTLFSPWKRVTAKRQARWDFEDFASALVANFVSRIVGMIMRLTLVIIGRILQLVWIVVGMLFYISWFVLPLILTGTLVYGVTLIFNL